MAARWTRTDTPPEGLAYVPEFLAAEEERELVECLAELPFTAVVMRGVAAKRTTVHYGWDYGYDSWTITPAAPVPTFLRPLRARVAVLAAVAADALAEVLVTVYPPGAAIGWHRDAPLFGPAVIGVSFGAPAVLRFRRAVGGAREVFRHPVAPRSAYVLAGAARATWQHSLAPVSAYRYSITFRTLSERARRRLAAGDPAQPNLA